MTTDVDTLARSAASDLHRRVEALDSEAALAAIHRSTGSGRHRVRRMVPSGRALAVVAAAVVLLAALAFAVGTGGGDDTERLGTQTTRPIDPTSYGPLLGELHGIDRPRLTAEVYGPQDLDDGSQVAVAISGGVPGQFYAVSQCASGDPNYNPPANCTYTADLRLDADGAGVTDLPVWSVFDGGFLFRNDCRAVACELQIEAIYDEDQPDDGVPGTKLAEQPDRSRALEDSPWVPLVFAPGAGAPPLPEVTATFLDRTDDGARVRILGRNFEPGPYSVEAEGFPETYTGLMAHAGGIGAKDLLDVDVPADGTISAVVTLPDTITDRSIETVDGVVQDPEVLTCGVGTAYCTIRVRPVDPVGRILTAPPVRYPEER